MADRWSKQYTPNFVTEASGGDTTAEVFQKHINELTRIYTLLSRVEKFDAGDSAPADKGEHSIWLDTSTNPATLKYWTGAAWQQVFPDSWAQDQDVNGHKIISSANGNIEINPNGTGVIILGATIRAGDNEDVVISPNGTGIIKILKKVVGDTNGNVEIEPNGTGKIVLDGPVELPTEGDGLDMNKNTAYFTLQTAAGTTLDFTKGNLWKKTLSGNVTLSFTAPPGVAWLTFIVVQDGSTAYDITWPEGIYWRDLFDGYYATGNDEPDLSEKGKTYIISFFHDGSNYFGSF